MEAQYLFSGSIRPTNFPWLSNTLMEEYPAGRSGYVAKFSWDWADETRLETRKNTKRAEYSDFFKRENALELKIMNDSLKNGAG